MKLSVILFLALAPVLFASGYAYVQPGGSIPITTRITVGGYSEGGVMVYFYASVSPYSGAHNHHDANRPVGWLYPISGVTGQNGCVTVMYYSPDVSGINTVFGYSGMGSDWAEIYVLVNQPAYLQILPNYSDYQKVGGTSNHPDAWWGTFNTVYRIQQIASQFRQQTGLIMGVNDMSLMWGGRLDLGPAYGGSYWGPPHAEHMIGTNVDIPYQYLGNYRSTFLQIAAQQQAYVYEEGNHYHLRFSN